MRLHILQEVDSTNTAAGDRERYSGGDIIVAINQTAGRGQRGNRWNSKPGDNLTFSIVLEPRFLPASCQFLLSETAALAVADTLEEYGVEARIKWTNDVYVKGNKICGMLIENDLKGNVVERSIVGIGLNVNQKQFAEWVPNPVSMAVETGSDYDILQVLERLLSHFEKRYGYLESAIEALAPDTQRDYNAKLFRRDEQHPYNIPGKGPVQGTIRNVLPTGELMVEIDGSLQGFLFKEIEFVI